MAQKVENNKGFLVIEMTPYEAIFICNFGAFGELICDDCNKLLNEDDNVYYIAALNQLFCKKCYENWLNYAVRYEEDIEYETNYFNHYAKLLNII